MNTPLNAVYAAISNVQTALLGKFRTTDTVNTAKYTYQYVPLPELLAIITPLLSENNIVAITTLSVEDGVNVLTVQVVHTNTNDYVQSSWCIGAASNLQADGGKLTYYSRRLLMGLLGIHPEDDTTEQVNVVAPSFMPPTGMQLPPGWTPPTASILPAGWTPPVPSVVNEVQAAPTIPPTVPTFKFAKPAN